MVLDCFGRMLCCQCGHTMRISVVTLDDERNGGKVVEFECGKCGDRAAMPLSAAQAQLPLESGARH